MEFGCLVSRVAKLHPNGGEWTLSRALGEAATSLEALEAKKGMAGKDFGELVRERRRQRGLPCRSPRRYSRSEPCHTRIE